MADKTIQDYTKLLAAGYNLSVPEIRHMIKLYEDKIRDTRTDMITALTDLMTGWEGYAIRDGLYHDSLQEFFDTEVTAIIGAPHNG